jgi:hypothetical protein
VRPRRSANRTPMGTVRELVRLGECYPLRCKTVPRRENGRPLVKTDTIILCGSRANQPGSFSALKRSMTVAASVIQQYPDMARSPCKCRSGVGAAHASPMQVTR